MLSTPFYKRRLTVDNNTQNTVVRQLLSLLPFQVNQRCVFDHYAKKLTVAKSMALFIVALLSKWPSYGAIETNLRANKSLQNALDLPEISGSQLCRKLNEIPTEFFLQTFLKLVAEENLHTATHVGLSKKIGKLGIIDSTSVKIPYSIQDWARLSSIDSSVKMHLRLHVASPGTVYPDHMSPTTRNYDDRGVAIDMVTDSDVTYVMDRGYVKYKTMDQWVNDGIRFVMRINNNHILNILDEQELPEEGPILRDATIRLGVSNPMKCALRLVEFVDDKGRTYRIVTTRYDLSAGEIAEIYRNRWLIELHFKWMKQHLRLVKMFSYKPQAVWNQLFMALIGYLLVLKIKREEKLTRTPWKILEATVVYIARSWKTFLAEVRRKPTRKSKGRQIKAGGSPPPISLESRIGWIKLNNPKPSKRKPRSKK